MIKICVLFTSYLVFAIVFVTIQSNFVKWVIIYIKIKYFFCPPDKGKDISHLVIHMKATKKVILRHYVTHETNYYTTYFFVSFINFYSYFEK